MTRPAPIIAGILAAFLLLFGAYMGSYYAMLDGDQSGWMEGEPPLYIYESDAIGAALWPAHKIDLAIRAGYSLGTF